MKRHAAAFIRQSISERLVRSRLFTIRIIEIFIEGINFMTYGTIIR